MNLLTGTNKTLINTGILLLRWMTGIIMFVAGAGKAAGWFGGFGMATTVGMFKTMMNISAFWTYVSCYTEFIGGFLLIIGLLTRPAAFLLTINMMVATYIVGPKNFFMGGGAFVCTLMVSSLVILLTGPMKYSLDTLLVGRKRNTINK
jgi:putative oxidoreductase